MNSPEPLGSVLFPVHPGADPSRMAIGQERDATNHPGEESFHGEIGRFVVYEGPLSDEDLGMTISYLQESYDL